jgi:hypothetical protein
MLKWSWMLHNNVKVGLEVLTKVLVIALSIKIET